MSTWGAELVTSMIIMNVKVAAMQAVKEGLKLR
jgi:hypothetical protein